MELGTDAARTLEEGRALFNAGRYFEAHEAWERAWLVETGNIKVLLQGLIQIAAGLLKAEGGAASPAARLLEAGVAKLAAAPPPAELADFVSGVTELAAEARAWERGEGRGLSSRPILPPFGGVKWTS